MDCSYFGYICTVVNIQIKGVGRGRGDVLANPTLVQNLYNF